MDIGQRIFLTGFSGSGKSSVGNILSRLLGWDFYDIDQLIVEREGRSISRIFAADGEEYFRAIEMQAIEQTASLDRVVISTGGGAIMQEMVRAILLNRGFLVALEATPETLAKRLSASMEQESGEDEVLVRPLLEARDVSLVGKIESIKHDRQWAYALAHCTISTENSSIHSVAQEIVRSWRRNPVLQPWSQDPLLAGSVVAEGGAYPVFVGWDSLESDLGSRLRQFGFEGRAFIVCDSNVVHPYGRAAQRSLHASGYDMGMFTFPAGESSKNAGTATIIYDWLAQQRVERRDAIIAVGGGVTGDLAGYVAATYLRGIRLVHVPTSLTAMVDSSIGGKTAIDLSAGKNMIGAFHHPMFVLTDPSALTTLPPRALREGWAEAIKHGFALDPELVAHYEAYSKRLLELNPDDVVTAVAKNIAIKAAVVTSDEKETSGQRMILNYGHTIGHALEVAGGFEGLLHGEAVSIGMAGAAALGEIHGVTPASVGRRQRDLLTLFGLPTRYEGLDPASILDAMGRDKKIAQGTLSWVLLKDAGSAAVYRDVESSAVEKVVKGLQS